jgi:hypothetical protein
VILTVWIVSISLSSVQLFVGRVQTVPLAVERSNSTNRTSNGTMYFVPNNANHSIFRYYERVELYQCGEDWSSDKYRQAYTLFNFFAVYLIPLFILAYTYTRIACIIKTTTHPGNADVSRDMQSNKSKRKVIKMLIILVCAFTLCWLVCLLLSRI